MVLEELITSGTIVSIDLKMENGAKYMEVSLLGNLEQIIIATKELKDMKEKQNMEIFISASITI